MMKTFKFRLLVLVTLLLLWGGLAAGALLYYSVIRRGQYLEMGNRLALRQGTIQATRGRILDCNGVVLAWSEKYYDLFLVNPPSGDIRREAVIQKLRLVLPESEPEVAGDAIWLLKTDLSPSQLMALEVLLRSYPELQIVPREERLVVDYPEVRRFIGRVAYRRDLMYGVDGAEKEYDVELSGTPGEYEVMLDRRRNWIAGTWKLLAPAISGEDMKLNVALADLLEKQQ
mgnify:CR=1 FL=1|jgi:cell division protein FtsI/penicillin-binding protein 2